MEEEIYGRVMEFISIENKLNTFIRAICDISPS